MENDRRHDPTARDRIGYIHDGYVSFARKASIAIGIQAVILILSLAAISYLVKQNHDNAVKIRVIAVHANRKAEHVRVLQELAKEKVCSQSSNRKIACRSLFERLYGSISNSQRHRLVCVVIDELRGPTVRAIRRQSHCR